MILEIQHETRLEYTAPVTEQFTEVRMEPMSDADQSCRSFHLRLSPEIDVHRYRDGFGNGVHHFNLRSAHKRLTILAAAVVETNPRPKTLDAVVTPFPIDESTLPPESAAMLARRGPVAPTPLLKPILDELAPRPGESVGAVTNRVMKFIKRKFEYQKDITQAGSPVDDVLKHGKGVCQDFAHLMIAILRGYGIPVRYVSGYIHRPNHESESHAWVEVWAAPIGWIGIDPTHDCLVGESFVKVAVGRDFTDVPPNKGIFRGAGTQTIRVRVESRELDRLPPLTWQEQLPPLQVPLREILSGRDGAGHTVTELEQQILQHQQQQQQ